MEELIQMEQELLVVLAVADLIDLVLEVVALLGKVMQVELELHLQDHLDLLHVEAAELVQWELLLQQVMEVMEVMVRRHLLLVHLLRMLEAEEAHQMLQ
jgi:hypothetical protein